MKKNCIACIEYWHCKRPQKGITVHDCSFFNDGGAITQKNKKDDFDSDPSENSKKQENTFYHQGSIVANQIKNISFILRTNEDKEPTIKIGEGYFWYRGEKIEDTKKVYELFADFLQKQRCNY